MPSRIYEGDKQKIRERGKRRVGKRKDDIVAGMNATRRAVQSPWVAYVLTRSERYDIILNIFTFRTLHIEIISEETKVMPIAMMR